MSAAEPPPGLTAEQFDALNNMTEMLRPFVEWCEGQKAEMERRGWSPTAAEEYASTLLIMSIRKIFSSA